MVFSSITFIYYFLPVTLLIYYISPRKYKNILFLLASLFFYSWGELRYIGLIGLSIAGNYFLGILLGPERIKRKHVLMAALVFNIGLLGIFKYTGFFISTINSVLGVNFPIPNIRLPLGISFFSFQALSYIIDVYREDVPPQKSIVNLALYITAFPQLIAGPIVRYNTVNKQIESREHSIEKFSQGIMPFLLGLGQKTLLANPLAVLADASFASTTDLSLLSAWLGLIAYTLQIYHDFSGYSHMAIGLGKMFGFEYEKNFNYPYISKSIKEFWSRWHISLGSWFRDYVYIPLGGNKVGSLKNIRNLFIVWFLTGMWHGASWNFILWGLYFGGLLFLERLSENFRKKIAKPILILTTFILVMIGWVFFRAEASSLYYFKSLLNLADGPLIDAQAQVAFHDYIGLIILALVFASPLAENIMAYIYNKLDYRINYFIESAIYIFILIMSTIYLVNSTYNPFIYFRF